MKQENIMNTVQLSKAVVIILLLTFYGCAEEEISAAPTSQNTSSLLADNPLPAGTSFDNFKTKNITIDPSALALSGDRIFLKLSSQSGDILFLGEIERFRLFNLQVNLRLDEDLLNYELFTNNYNDATQYGLIIL